jgi:2-polyprenyl-6-hydroxyphenyl methylase/3-demethylubiquinone-9 3-methyltransferase
MRSDTQAVDLSGYRYASGAMSHSHGYLLPSVNKILDSLALRENYRRIFELGCNSGSVANVLQQRGWDIIGVDPSKEGVEQARRSYPRPKIAFG